MDKKYTVHSVDPSATYSQEFWDNYTLFLIKHGVSKGSVSWYVLRTKQYISAFPDQHIRTHTGLHVEEYLNKVGREVRLKAYQFGQVVDAIRLLFCRALRLGWANDFDWAYWQASARKLEADHATVARDYTDALKGLEMLDGEEKCSNELYERYQPELAEVVRLVRLKNYSMRTEKTYRGWIARFFYFHKPRNVRDLTGKHVKQPGVSCP